MTTIFKRSTNNTALITLVAAMLAPAVAGAVVLPERGPIPAERPTAEIGNAIQIAPPARDVVRISTNEQEIPDARRDVRVVGANFLPPADESIDFASINERPTIASQTENFVMGTMTLLFAQTEEEAPLQLASTAP